MKLPNLNKSKEYRKYYRFHLEGEPAFLRAINPKNELDFVRYKKIFQDPKVEEYMQGVGSKASVKELQKILRTKDDTLIFAIANANDKNKRMEGWVQLCADEKHRVKQIYPNKEKLSNDELTLEISFARYTGRKNKIHTKGLISSGVRQTCLQIKRLEQIYAENTNKKLRKISVNAYVSKDNKASIRVLEHAGFVKKKKIEYNNTKFKKYKNDDKLYYYKLSDRKLTSLVDSQK